MHGFARTLTRTTQLEPPADRYLEMIDAASEQLGELLDELGLAARIEDGAAEPIHVRMGLHTGEAIRERDDFFGRNVILAARIAAQANGGEVLVSSLLKELTESSGDIAFGAAREVTLKGLSGSYRVHSVDWEGVGAGAG